MNFFIITLFILSGSLFAYPSHSPQLASPIRVLYQFEETRQLIGQAEAEGALYIQVANLGLHASNAAWFPDERMIRINFSKKRSQGSLICSLVFEIHNALSQKQFDYFDRLAMQGKISKEKYIETIEYLEYTNALKTAKVLKNGINKGIFPPDAYYSVAPSFTEHFMIQKQAGHSQFIGDLWQSLNKNRKI
jgi:hypothetical protein